MATIHLTRGHNLKLAGQPNKEIFDIPCPKQVTLVPDNFPGIKPKMLVKVGDLVKVGSKIYHDKKNSQLYFTSPVSGCIKDIELGDRRKIEKIVISCDNNEEDFAKPSTSISEISEKEIKDTLLQSGLWPMIRQRPFSKIANYNLNPKAIFVTAMPNAPFSLDLDIALNGKNDCISAGISIINKLTKGNVNLVLDRNKKYSIFNEEIECEKHYFSGPYPSGNTGVHIHHIDPISGRDDIVWYISLQDLSSIGDFFLNGKYPSEKIISAGGSCLSNPQYYRIKRGATISDILNKQHFDSESILISGDVLTGQEIEMDMPLNFYHEGLSLIPFTKKRDFLGWILPGIEKYSVSRVFLSSLFKKKVTNMDTRINGSRRAIIPFGRWESMLPMDLIPDFIVKSILAKDIEDMEKYGIYECDPEDFSMCAYACQSKVEVTKIIDDGLKYMEQEG